MSEQSQPYPSRLAVLRSDSLDHSAPKDSVARGNNTALNDAAFNEAETFRQLADEVNGMQKREADSLIKRTGTTVANFDRSGVCNAGRALHASTHIAIKTGTFRINRTIPTIYRSPLFTENAEYDAWIRLSQGSGARDATHGLRGPHGIAVRLLIDPGGHTRVVDLTATNYPTAHGRNAWQHLLPLRYAAGKCGIRRYVSVARILLPYSFGGTGFSEGLRVFRALVKSSRKITSLASTTYFSRTPYAIGSEKVAVKFRFKPVGTDSVELASGRDDKTSLGACLKRDLEQRDVCFEFQVQKYINEKDTPIEDATVLWPTDYVTLATLTLSNPENHTDAPQCQQQGIERECFNPWHCTAYIEPLGGLNRARRFAYESSHLMRQGLRSGSERRVLLSIAARFGLRLLRLSGREFYHWRNRCFALVHLALLRITGQEQNLFDVPASPLRASAIQPESGESNSVLVRAVDGSGNDLLETATGSVGSRFGRAMPVASTKHIHNPDPVFVSEKLLHREMFVPAKGLNYLVAAWLQFQVHDWFSHQSSNAKACAATTIYAPQNGLDPVDPTPEAKGGSARYSLAPRAYATTQTFWWDASQLYGSNKLRQGRIREPRSGRLRLTRRELLPLDHRKRSTRGQLLDLTGVNENYWVGLSLLHTLFAREHNAVYDALKAHHSELSECALFDKCRLVVAALIAKIHTLEWSKALLATPTFDLAFDTYWHGLASSKKPHESLCTLFNRLSPEQVQNGIPGSATSRVGVPFSQTEEFVAVYRMHSMLRDKLDVYRLDTDQRVKLYEIDEMIGSGARRMVESAEHSISDLIYSFGITEPGDLCLNNLPKAFTHHRRANGRLVDVGALDILRDRERGILRYNDFREALGMQRKRDYADLTSNRNWQNRLREVYGNNGIDMVDLLIGTLAEKRPEGFGFSDTVFRIFLISTSRRLGCDRFYTTHYNPDTYTETGFQWIHENSFRSVLLRHYPQLESVLNKHPGNIFSIWPRVASSRAVRIH